MLNFNLLVGFCLFGVFCVAKIYLKSIWNCLEFVLTVLFTILIWTPTDTSLESLFLTNFGTYFFTTPNYFFVCALMFIFVNFFLSVRTYFHLSKSIFIFKTYFYLYALIFICQNLFSSVKIYFHLCELNFICENLFFSWPSLRIFSFICGHL